MLIESNARAAEAAKKEHLYKRLTGAIEALQVAILDAREADLAFHGSADNIDDLEGYLNDLLSDIEPDQAELSLALDEWQDNNGLGRAAA